VQKRIGSFFIVCGNYSKLTRTYSVLVKDCMKKVVRRFRRLTQIKRILAR